MRRRLICDDDSGVTTVEFALVLPIFIFLVGIAFYFSWMFFVQSQVNRAADRAARYAAVAYSSTSDQPYTDPTTGQTYLKTVTTKTYAYCESKVVDKVNTDLATGTVTMPTANPSPSPQTPGDYEVQISDGSKNGSGNPSGPLPVTSPCAQPVGFVKVQITKDFTNPFSILIAPFTGSTSTLRVTGTGRARVEAE